MNVLLKGKKQCKVNSSPFEERNKSTGNWQLQIDPIKTKEQISHTMLMVIVFSFTHSEIKHGNGKFPTNSGF
jgi:hypothetical protein